MKCVEGKGSTQEEAVSDALSKLSATIDDVEIEVIKKEKKLFGLLGEGVTIRATLKDQPEVKEEEDGAEQSVAGDSSTGEADALTIMRNILEKMDFPGDVSESIDGDTTNLNVTTEKGGLLIGRRGETLDSLEYIVNRIVNKSAENRVFITLDTENYRERRKDKLIEMAKTAAEEVRKQGRPYKIPNLNAKERKIIHMAIQDEEGLETASEGEGFDRRIVITKQ